MNKESTGTKIRDSKTSIVIRFFAIFAFVLVSQIPGCVVVIADDAGQINYFEHETLIELSKFTFAFPLRLIINKVNSDEQLLMVYMLNLVLISLLILMAFKGWNQIRKRVKEVSD